MEMSGQARLNATRQQVWDALNDPEVLKQCIPGCETMDKLSDSEMTATVISKVGPIKARFTGKVTLTDVVAPRSYTLVGEGQGGMAGFAKADIGVTLEALEEHVTLLNYGVKANVGGKLAQLGARLIDATARKSADEFFEKFSSVIEGLAVSDPHRGAPLEKAEPAAAGVLAVADASDPAVPKSEGLVSSSTRQGRATALRPPGTATSEGTQAAMEALADVWVASQIEVFIADGVALVTLNRPKQRNAMTYAMWRAIPGIFAALDRDDAVRAIILTGSGADFCAGADIREFDKVRDDVAQATAYEVAVDACCNAITDVSKPTIAVIKGFCLGGGAHLAMSCDFRFAAADAQFGIPAARLSVVYGVSGTRKLLALVGLANAKRILFGGDRFRAAEAHRIGFVSQVAHLESAPQKRPWWLSIWSSDAQTPAAADVMVDARVFANKLAGNAPLSMLGAKSILNQLALAEDGLDPEHAEQLIAAAASSQDYREGRAAFLARRDPKFTGQ